MDFAVIAVVMVWMMMMMLVLVGMGIRVIDLRLGVMVWWVVVMVMMVRMRLCVGVSGPRIVNTIISHRQSAALTNLDTLVAHSRSRTDNFRLWGRHVFLSAVIVKIHPVPIRDAAVRSGYAARVIIVVFNHIDR